jgi:hypothetical protein
MENSDPQSAPNIPQLNPSPFNVIFSFDIPGFKIIVIPVFHPMSISMTSEMFGFDIPGFKLIVIPVNQMHQMQNQQPQPRY